MNLGEKIKRARTAKKLTQAQLCKKKITRNMLSAIESGKANPSLETLHYISEALSLPLSYLLSDDDDLLYYEKKDCIEEIKKLFREKKFKSCIEKIKVLDGLDDELAYILAISYFELAKSSVIGGSLKSGSKYLKAFEEYSAKTVYDTTMQRNSALLYSALISNIQSPLLEMDTDGFEHGIREDYDYDFYKYISADKDYEHKNPNFKAHLQAKELIKNRKYKEALKKMLDMLDEKEKASYNAYLVFTVYADIEYCYKQLLDFENAYRYASKRLSIIEGFKL